MKNEGKIDLGKMAYYMYAIFIIVYVVLLFETT